MTTFVDKENVVRPLFSCALAIRGQIGSPGPGGLLEAFPGSRLCRKLVAVRNRISPADHQNAFICAKSIRVAERAIATPLLPHPTPGAEAASAGDR
jgi:hypothetical protein